MVRRCIDVVLAGLAIVGLAPVWLLALAAVKVSSPGPALYRARRTGWQGREFTLLKLRTMHRRDDGDSPITRPGDPRVFRVGRWLRASKIDELPQLLNVLKGDMAIVGPRPEDPDIVRRYYSPADLETLRVRPGLASPGSLYNFTHGEQDIAGDDAVAAYVEAVLPVKLALDRVYLERASLWYDVRVVGRTLGVLAARACGRRRFPLPPELREVRHRERRGAA